MSDPKNKLGLEDALSMTITDAQFWQDVLENLEDEEELDVHSPEFLRQT